MFRDFSGDIYLQEDYDLSDGSAQEIYEGISNIVFSKMIPSILDKRPQLRKQAGEFTLFKRRNQEQSNLQSIGELSLVKLYDFIRMLDAQS